MPLSDHNGKASFNIGGKEFANQSSSGTPIYKITSTDSGGGGNIIGGHGGVIAYCYTTHHNNSRIGVTTNPLAVSYQGSFIGGSAQGDAFGYKNETTETLIILPIYFEPSALVYFAGGFWQLNLTSGFASTLYRSYSSGFKIAGTGGPVGSHSAYNSILLSNSGSYFGLQSRDSRNVKGSPQADCYYTYIVLNEMFGFTGDQLKTFFNNNTIASELSSTVDNSGNRYKFWNW